ncbi:DNA mismatch repair protein MutS [Pseudoflavitalea sp. G-6-1-2]|uniref:MutS-related protein n=1 Tax=Pseudoflavitalea sp. G-6-1-2 TaxID=2728841 RepID=UPI00146C8281|nr:DNA mismatch repair protein MutS [Pseudoflavitalea sp. G-6-1-2]NML20620.1 DNA mismatch repair protein MutS [Pseudoflavitalea sp. G-6-1-2]
MQIDNTTFNDLSIFQHEEEFSIFHRLNFTQTVEGREWLLKYFLNPFNDPQQIAQTQQILKVILANLSKWPTSISNGTLMVMERFYDTGIDSIPSPGFLNAFTYRVFHVADYSLVRYSISHFGDFVKGMDTLINFFDENEVPLLVRSYLHRAKDLLNKPILKELMQRNSTKKLEPREVVYYGGFLRDHFKSQALELISIYGRFDAWYSMARAMQHFKLTFPEFIDSPQAAIDAKQLYHILLPTPVSYDVRMDKESNFLFLTGANMAGKSTFIKAVGSSVYLAHLGMGVPAEHMRLTIFDGLLSNINVMDNIVKGESYFFNEVQRIRDTIIRINDGKKWLVLIDELFKGTNVQDAMKCSSTVIKGLIKIRSSLFILSTHLYEIGEELKVFPNISFRYFETTVSGDQLHFSYQLKEGISNDRLGYLILKREKVVELLEKL